jgi:hypothetical protein
MTPLDNWIERATRGLSNESAAQVRREIVDHYESALEAAVAAGAVADAAERSALSALGDGETVNRQYRRVLLTSSEARLLSDNSAEARAFRTGNGWIRWLLLAVSLGALVVARVFYELGAGALARVALASGIGTIFWLAVPLLPIDTPLRGRIVRGFKWLVQAGTLWLAFGPGALGLSWLIVLLLGHLSWTEWKRASIRRKLSARQWPKHLYL